LFNKRYGDIHVYFHIFQRENGGNGLQEMFRGMILFKSEGAGGYYRTGLFKAQKNAKREYFPLCVPALPCD